LNEIGQGLVLSGIGIVITFSALGILILVIILLKKMFPVVGAALNHDYSDSTGEGKDQSDQDRLRTIAAAAAAAAISLQKRKNQASGLGEVLETPPGNWWFKMLDRIQTKE
jgi:Na+-transporting methylmalonyl-CoA/oxaloacetate decarboxylase gamma subunit